MENPGELMTIKAFAEAAGRSQQTIYKQIGTRLASYVHERDGQKYIERRALAEVFKIGEVQPPQPENNNSLNFENNPEHPLYAILKAELEAKNHQLDEKDRLIEQLRKDLADERQHSRAQADKLAELAKGAQALHAGTMKQLGTGEQLDQECQDETAIDAEPGEPEQAQAAPDPKPAFWQRCRKAWNVLKGE